MPALVAADFTVSQVGKAELGRQSKTVVTDLTFGDGAKTYPTGGIPLPTLANLGFRRNIESIHIPQDSSGDGFVYKVDHANHKLLIYTQGVAHGAAGAVALDDYPVTAGVGVTAGVSVSFNGPAGAQTTRIGSLKELAATDTPAATTIRCVIRGW